MGKLTVIAGKYYFHISNKALFCQLYLLFTYCTVAYSRLGLGALPLWWVFDYHFIELYSSIIGHYLKLCHHISYQSFSHWLLLTHSLCIYGQHSQWKWAATSQTGPSTDLELGSIHQQMWIPSFARTFSMPFQSSTMPMSLWLMNGMMRPSTRPSMTWRIGMFCNSVVKHMCYYLFFKMWVL